MLTSLTSEVQFGPNSASAVAVPGASVASLLAQINLGPTVAVSGACIGSDCNNGYTGSWIQTGPMTGHGTVPAGTKISGYNSATTARAPAVPTA